MEDESRFKQVGARLLADERWRGARYTENSDPGQRTVQLEIYKNVHAYTHAEADR